MSLEAKAILHSKCEHICYGCRTKLPKGCLYIAYPVIMDKKLHWLKICHACAVCLLHKTGDRAKFIREGEFSESKIPNFLRKIRDEFMRDPKAFSEKHRNDIEVKKQDAPLPKIVVSHEMFSRSIIHIDAGRRNPIKRFPKGSRVVLIKGVGGEQKKCTIQHSCVTDGSGFGMTKKQVTLWVS